MKYTWTKLHNQRLALQKELDENRSQSVRNRMGQFATPPDLAGEILSYAKEQLSATEKVRFLDPAFGTGSFYSALLKVFPKNQVCTALGYEIDHYYGKPASALWHETSMQIRLADFTKSAVPPPDQKFNLIICNPPYIRHHHIITEEKQRLKLRVLEACGAEVNGLAGMYCYFLGISHAWLTEDGLAGWLIPSEFMDVNYGIAIKKYLLEKVTLLHLHRFDPQEVQFGDALVSSAVVWFRKRPPTPNHEVRFSFGGSLRFPKEERLVRTQSLREERKWSRFPRRRTRKKIGCGVLGDFFRVKRGLATGGNKYFILSEEQIKRRELPIELFQPILPSPRYLCEDEVRADSNGNPLLDQRLFLLTSPHTETEIRDHFPKLWSYLEEGERMGIADRYICRHRKPWYSQEHRPPVPFLCTYLGRTDKKGSRPFRFILNDSNAIATNVYLMLYPKSQVSSALQESSKLKRQVWLTLNEIASHHLIDEGRVYGGGLHKLEPRDLENVPSDALTKLLSGGYKHRTCNREQQRDDSR